MGAEGLAAAVRRLTVSPPGSSGAPGVSGAAAGGSVAAGGAGEGPRYLVKFSMLQIYQELISDLLNTE